MWSTISAVDLLTKCIKSDKCAPVVKRLVELDASGEHLALCLCCLARLVGQVVPRHFVKASYTTGYSI